MKRPAVKVYLRKEKVCFNPKYKFSRRPKNFLHSKLAHIDWLFHHTSANMTRVDTARNAGPTRPFICPAIMQRSRALTKTSIKTRSWNIEERPNMTRHEPMHILSAPGVNPLRSSGHIDSRQIKYWRLPEQQTTKKRDKPTPLSRLLNSVNYSG